MMPQSVVDALNSFTAPQDEDQLNQLDGIVSDLSPGRCGPDEIRALLAVFERFPEEDGHGIFWSILHKLEKCREYEPALVESVARAPGEFNVLMINRLLNGGIAHVQDVSLLSVLLSVASNPDVPSSVRSSAQRFVRHQEQRGSV